MGNLLKKGLVATILVILLLSAAKTAYNNFIEMNANSNEIVETN